MDENNQKEENLESLEANQESGGNKSYLSIIIGVIILVIVFGVVIWFMFNTGEINEETTLNVLTTEEEMVEDLEDVVSVSEDEVFTLLIPGEVKGVSNDLIPFHFNEDQAESPANVLVVRISEQGSSEIAYEISLFGDDQDVPFFYLPSYIENGVYDLEVLTVELGMLIEEFTTIYETQISVEREVADQSLVSIEQTYPLPKDSWDGVVSQTFFPDEEVRFLEFEISNNSDFPLEIQAFEMGTEAGGVIPGFIESLSVHQSSNGEKLASVNSLNQTSQVATDYTIYYLDNPLEIASGESLLVEFRITVSLEFFDQPPSRTDLSTFVYQTLGQLGEGVLRKEEYMTPRARHIEN